MTTPTPKAAFVPAYHCEGADMTLRWSPTDLGWRLRYRGRLIAVLPGYPVGAKQNSANEALAWANSVAGPQVWIEKPQRSGAFHTHDSATCTTQQ